MDPGAKTVYHDFALDIRENLQIMKVSLRVLAAISDRLEPEPADIDTLRYYLGSGAPPANLDELACEVIKKALVRRARIRAAMKELARLSHLESSPVYSPRAPDPPHSPFGQGMARANAESEPAAQKQAK